jgi:WD40 repeat protein
VRRILMLIVMVSSLVGLVTAQQADRFKDLKVETLPQLTDHYTINTMAVSPDAALVASGSSDGTILLLDVATKKVIHTLRGDGQSVRSVEFNPNGTILASGSSGHSAYLWNVKTGREIMRNSDGFVHQIFSVNFHPKKPLLAIGYGDGKIAIWDFEKNIQVGFLKAPSEEILSVMFSTDGESLASSTSSGSIMIWDIRTGKIDRQFYGDKSSVWSVAFSQDGKYLASSSTKNAGYIWSATTGNLIHKLEGHSESINSIKFSPDSNWIVTGSSDKSFKIWNAKTAQEVHSVNRFSDAVNTIDFSPDGRFLVAGLEDGTISFVSNSRKDIFGASPTWLEKYGQTQTPKTGSLELRSNNEGATLTINGENKGVTGASRLLDLPPGTYTVVVSASSFKPQTQTIIIESGKTANAVFNLEWQDSTLNVRSNNDGANISINGEVKGVTGATRDFKLQPGTYSVEVDAPGFKTQKQTVVIVGGRNANVVFNLEREVVAAPEPKPTEVAPVSTPTSSGTTTSNTTTIAPRAVPRSSIRALVIGIGTYRDKNIRKLEYSESDASKFVDALTDTQIGNIPKENVTTLIGSNATQNTINTKIKKLAGQTKTGETLIVYFSGHGTPSSDGEAWLLPWDADQDDLPSSVVSLSSLQATRTEGGNLILILDSCFSGGTSGKSIDDPNAKPFGVQIKQTVPTGSVTVLSASSGNQTSFESRTRGGGLFTSYLIEGLTGKADTNADGTITLEEAFRYAKPKVELESNAKHSTKQSPELRGNNTSFALGENTARTGEVNMSKRLEKLQALAQSGKITSDQLVFLKNKVRSGQEPEALKKFLDGDRDEAWFLDALEGIPGMPK